jgi:hypothetical protein
VKRFFVIMMGLIAVNPARAFDGVAILGDSMSTGAAAHPQLEFDSWKIWDIFNGKNKLDIQADYVPPEFRKFTKNLESPTRVRPSIRENDGGSGWLWHNVTQILSAKTLEEHRLSFGYFVGLALGVGSKDILLAGENGARASRAWMHASRLIGARGGDIPDKIIMLYTGNDLCAQNYDEITSADEYGNNLLSGMKYIVINAHTPAQGSKIFLPAFLPVTSLINETSILERKIRLNGDEMTCKDARAKMFATKGSSTEGLDDSRFQVFKNFIPPSPVLLCPTLFHPAAQDGAKQTLLANRIRAYRDAQKKAVSDFNEWRGRRHPGKAFEAVYLDGPEQVRFTGEDVAGDCFHLSARGQGKVASAILRGIL